MEAEEIIELLGLEPHPEGGHYRETFRDPEPKERSASTAIYFLLREGEASHWHRIDAIEVWHRYAGDPCELSLSTPEGEVTTHILGENLKTGERPQVVVPRFHWQAARSLGKWTLIGCTVAPGFEFAHFELAEPDWTPQSLKKT